jgi:hypothetical protein
MILFAISEYGVTGILNVELQILFVISTDYIGCNARDITLSGVSTIASIERQKIPTA